MQQQKLLNLKTTLIWMQMFCLSMKITMKNILRLGKRKCGNLYPDLWSSGSRLLDKFMKNMVFGNKSRWVTKFKLIKFYTFALDTFKNVEIYSQIPMRQTVYINFRNYPKFPYVSWKIMLEFDEKTNKPCRSQGFIYSKNLLRNSCNFNLCGQAFFLNSNAFLIL